VSVRRATMPSPKSVPIATPTKVSSKTGVMNSGRAKASVIGTANNNRKPVRRLATEDYGFAMGGRLSAITDQTGRAVCAARREVRSRR